MTTPELHTEEPLWVLLDSAPPDNILLILHQRKMTLSQSVYGVTMYQYRVWEIKRVVDGDTVDVVIDLGFGVFLAHRVRLKGINAPETRTLDYAEKAKGLASKDWLLKELTNDKRWIIETTKEDKYGRYLGVFFAEGDSQSLNERMLREGMALPFMVND